MSGGSGPDLSLIEFKPGSAQLGPTGAAALERVAKALLDRPALRLTVSGQADAAAEREAMMAAALQTRVLAEARREIARAGQTPAADAPPPVLSADEYARILKRLYTATALPDKPRNLVGMAKDLPVPQMESMLRQAMPPGPDAARELALQRGLVVRDALIAKGLPSERLFLGAPKLHTASDKEAGWTPRAQLALEVR